MQSPLMLKAMSSAVRNRLASFLGFSHAGARDLYEQFGYPRELLNESLMGMYMRNAIANRIITAFPAATWRDKPVIRDDAGDSAEPDGDSYSPFVEAVDDLFDKHRIYHFIERADRLASIGRFGVLLIGAQDGKKLHEPWEDRKAKLLYLQPFTDLNVTINQFDSNPRSPRFGKPVLYTLQQNSLDGGRVGVSKSMSVHWTRVIHIAEKLDQDEVYGVPRLMPVFNDLMSLEKVIGSSAETFWLNARPGLGITTDAEAIIDAAALADMKEQATEYDHQLRRILALQGANIQQLGATVADPKPNCEMLLDVIAGSVGIPKRILIGSERGELSSNQDENNWSERIGERRRNFATPSILQPLVTRLIQMQALPEPEGKWIVEWPEDDAMSEERKATVALTKSNTLRNYVTSPGAELLVPPQEFRTDFLGMDPESEYDLPEDYEVPLPEGEPANDDELVEEDVDPATVKAMVKAIKKLPNAKGKKNAKPRTLYVKRDVLNWKEIEDWAKSQGFKTTLGKDMHVTVAYSKAKVDWMKVGEAYNWGTKDGVLRLVPGGPRVVEELGRDEKCACLLFKSLDLFWRHKDILAAGATWSWPEYQPHITISYDIEGVDLSKIKPFSGEIVLGPEIFEEVESDLEIVENRVLHGINSKVNLKRGRQWVNPKSKPKQEKKTNVKSNRSKPKLSGQQRGVGNGKRGSKTGRKR
jgi:hypothetical protein